MYMGEGLSRMMGNCQVRFFGGRDAATYALLPDHLEFLPLGKKFQERELENALVAHIRDFLMELGVGFAFVGSQYYLNIGGEDFYLDLLFYHLELRCFIIIDLKMGGFKAEYSGKMNLYVSAVDDLLRKEHDNPTIGIILASRRTKRLPNTLYATLTRRSLCQPTSYPNSYRKTCRLPSSWKWRWNPRLGKLRLSRATLLYDRDRL